MNDNQKVKLWCKNQRTGNIFGEYYDEFQQEHRSYFDFIIKFNNGNYLYLEVKGSNDKDIDKSKTDLLKQAYESYFNNNTLFANRIVLCVVEVEKENIKKISPFYDQKQFDDILETFDLENVVKKLVV